MIIGGAVATTAVVASGVGAAVGGTIAYNKKKKKDKKKRIQKIVFGQDPTFVKKLTATGIPIVIEEAINSLRILNAHTTPNLFDLKGNNARIFELSEFFDKNLEVDLTLESIPNIVGLLKYYFKEMPRPLLDPPHIFQNIGDLLERNSIDHNTFLQKARGGLTQIPQANLLIYMKVFPYFFEVIKYQNQNGVSARSISDVFTGLICEVDESKKIDFNDLLKKKKKTKKMLKNSKETEEEINSESIFTHENITDFNHKLLCIEQMIIHCDKIIKFLPHMPIQHIKGNAVNSKKSKLVPKQKNNNQQNINNNNNQHYNNNQQKQSIVDANRDRNSSLIDLTNATGSGVYNENVTSFNDIRCKPLPKPPASPVQSSFKNENHRPLPKPPGSPVQSDSLLNFSLPFDNRPLPKPPTLQEFNPLNLSSSNDSENENINCLNNLSFNNDNSSNPQQEEEIPDYMLNLLNNNNSLNSPIHTMKKEPMKFIMSQDEDALKSFTSYKDLEENNSSPINYATPNQLNQNLYPDIRSSIIDLEIEKNTSFDSCEYVIDSQYQNEINEKNNNAQDDDIVYI